MPVTIYIPGPLRQFSGGVHRVQLLASPNTVRDALDELWQMHPGIRDRVLDEEGRLREHINIFVGNENVRYTGDFATRLLADAEISILPAVSGGTEENAKPGHQFNGWLRSSWRAHSDDHQT